MFKFLSMFNKTNIQGVHDRLENVLDRVGSLVGIVTNTIESLENANNELKDIALECAEVIKKHQTTLDSTAEQLRQNEQLIVNLEKLIGKQ